jgi:hypothetical protein
MEIPLEPNALLEEYREDDWGRRRMFAARNGRAGELRRRGFVVDVETIKVLEAPASPGARPRVVRIARLLAYRKDAVRTAVPPANAARVA